MSHDLSGPKVKLDYTMLVSCAVVALRYTKVELERQDYAMRDALDALQNSAYLGRKIATGDIVKADSASEYHRQAAQDYECAVKTFTHLLAMRERPEVEIINRPEVK